MERYESLNHTKWECKYHVVWIPKGRKKVLYAQLRKELEGCCGCCRSKKRVK